MSNPDTVTDKIYSVVDSEDQQQQETTIGVAVPSSVGATTVGGEFRPFMPSRSSLSSDPFHSSGTVAGGQRRGTSAISVHDYMLNTTRFDSKRFTAIPEYGTNNNDPGKVKRGRQASWEARLLHVPCRIRVPVGELSDLYYYRLSSEESYRQRAGEILRRNEDLGFGVHMVGHPIPYFKMYWLDRVRWGKFQADESRIRSRGDGFLHCWHNTEFFDVPRGSRNDLYVRQPIWWKEYEVSPWLGVATPSAVAYFGSMAWSDKQSETFWTMVTSEWIVNVFVAFVDAAQKGVHHTVGQRYQGEGLLPDNHRPAGRLFYLSSAVISRIETYGVSHLVKGSQISEKTVKGLIQRVRDYRWCTDEEFVIYDWATDTVWGAACSQTVARPVGNIQRDPYAQDMLPYTDCNQPVPTVAIERDPYGETVVASSLSSHQLFLKLQDVCRQCSEPVPETMDDVLRFATNWTVRANMHSWLIHNMREYQNHLVQRSNNLVTTASEFAVSLRRSGETVLQAHDAHLRHLGTDISNIQTGSLGIPCGENVEEEFIPSSARDIRTPRSNPKPRESKRRRL